MEMHGSAVGRLPTVSGSFSDIDASADKDFDPAKWIRGLGYMAKHVSADHVLLTNLHR
jgi:hypothetical protein